MQLSVCRRAFVVEQGELAGEIATLLNRGRRIVGLRFSIGASIMHTAPSQGSWIVVQINASEPVKSPALRLIEGVMRDHNDWTSALLLGS